MNGVNHNNLNLKSYFTHYMVAPNSRDLSPKERRVAMVATGALIVLTAGVLPAVLTLFRDFKYVSSPQSKVYKWQKIAGRRYNWEFLSNYDSKQRNNITQWLTKLEATEDYSRYCRRNRMAKNVCGMLQSLKDNEEFREQFFAQIEENLESCSDRAGMTYNQLFTTWKLATLDPKASMKDRLSLLAGIAKTLTLRDAVTQALADRDDGVGGSGESAEKYLYYENHLKDCLGLVSALEVPAGWNRALGYLSNLDKNFLIMHVQDNYVRKMVEMPAFEKLIEEDNKYLTDKEIIHGKAVDALGELDPQISDQQYREEINKIQAKRESAITQLKIRWVNEHLS